MLNWYVFYIEEGGTQAMAHLIIIDRLGMLMNSTLAKSQLRVDECKNTFF